MIGSNSKIRKFSRRSPTIKRVSSSNSKAQF
jgi:hypothetical protein